MTGKLRLMAHATALLLTFLAFAATAAALSGPAAAAPKPCWKQVVDDWSQDGSIDKTYPAACIDEALARVPEDIRAYSDFEEQAKSARGSNSRRLQNVTGSGSGSSSGGSSEGAQPLKEADPDTGPRDETPIQSALQSGNNADAFPLPLLILLGLAGALLSAGALGFGHRKLAARRAPK
jgi:hypothetical protein